VLEAAHLPLVLLDPAGAVRRANQAAGLLLESTADSLAALTGEAWRRLLKSFFVEAGAAEGQTAGAEGEWTQRLQTRTLPRRMFQLESRPVRLPNGSVVGRLELFRDITDRERAGQPNYEDAQQAREIDQLQARLEQAEKFKMELTANVSHDLRTPLASIKASVSGLLAGDVVYQPEVLRETLSVIEEETDRLQRRVQNLLSMSRMEAGDAIQSRDWVDVPDVVASAMEALRSVQGGRKVVLAYPDDLPLVLADYDQLQIAIRNLVENAFLYAPPDTPVEVGVAVSLGQLRIRVRDYGAGLMPDEAERVFEKFYRGRSARRIPGTGLGLPICRGIAEAHGGRLWAEHVAGGGVAFVLSIPLEGAAPD